ncbi:MAG: hypothetical protein ABI726_09515 [bacterium]
MINRLRDPITLFRFALKERDWPLAGLLAGTLGRDVNMRSSLEHEVRASASTADDGPASLGALRTLGALIRLLGPQRRRG